MILKLSVFAAAILQVVAAAVLPIGTFEEASRNFMVYIQPAGWAFSVWGLIYALSFIYAVYQLIPKHDNELLRATRLPALVGFLGSVAWLYFAGTDDWQLWLTAPTLFLIAISLTFVVSTTDTTSQKTNLLSKEILFPYAAWTGIAAWLNVQTLLSQQGITTSEPINLVTNSLLFVCITVYSLYFFKRSGYSIFYGGVIIWASIGVIYVNLNEGKLVFALLAGALALATSALYVRKCWQEEKQT